MASLSSSAARAAGIVYGSVRHAPVACIGAFCSDVAALPAQGAHFHDNWDGGRITYARKITGDRSIVAL